MNADATVGAKFAAPPPPPAPPPGHSFALNVTTHGAGKVFSNPQGIDCGRTCSATYPDGAAVALSAVPDSGWKLSGWSGACSGAGDCRVTMNAEQNVEAMFEAVPPPPPPPPPPADECADLTPSSLPQPVRATPPQSDCLGGTSDDGAGNYLLGYMAGSGPNYPNYLFFTVQNGQAQRIGDVVPGGDESGTYVFSQPSGFTSFHVSGPTGGSNVNSYSHDGKLISTQQVAVGGLQDGTSPSSQIGIDPSGGTALVRSQKDSTGAFVTAYRRLDKSGTPETDWVAIDTSATRTSAGAVGVSLTGDVLVLLADAAPAWRARWLTRAGAPLTGWFAAVSSSGFPELHFLMDGSLALRFRSTTYPNSPGPWIGRFEEGKSSLSGPPGWLAQRGSNDFYVIRKGRAYAAWGSSGSCGSGLEVIAASGKSCGCLAVPNLGPKSSIGRDGSLITNGPESNPNKCPYELYPQLLE
jgi:Divergent InlB B-repeat domain